MLISPSRRTGATLGVLAATSVLTVALACSDSLAPHGPRGSGGPRFLYQDPALESPPSASGSIDLPPFVTTVGGMSTLVGHFPYSTVVRFDVSGSHILSSVTGHDGSGTYGLQGRSCQTGYVGTTYFGGATTSWNACNAAIGNQRTDYSDYINLSGDVYLYHAGDGGSTPAYPDCTHDCFYIGGGSQLTLTRIEASLDLTTADAPAQSAGVYVVSPGTSLMFGWAVTPASVSSAGGDIKLGAVTNSSSWEITRPAGNVVGCPYFPFASGNNYRYCQVRADSALTVKLTAITNGAWKSKSIQVIPRRNFRLQGPSSGFVGDTATYTATLDGQAIRATRWVWVPTDTSTHDASSGWDDSASTSRHKSMVTSGTMKAYLDYASGGTDSATAATTVTSKFTLTASRSSVSYGDSVTFTPLLNGAPTAVSRWKYVPTDTSSRDSTACAGQTSVCVKRMQRSGTMSAWLASDSTRSAAAYVTVDAGCVPGPTFSKTGTPALNPGPRTTGRGRPGMTPESLRVGVESRDVICGGDGGTGPGTGSDSSRRLVMRQYVGDGVTSSISLSDSLFRAGDTVHYNFGRQQGYLAPIVYLDSVEAPDSGTVVMSRDHSFIVEADSDFAQNPELRALIDSLRTLFSAQDPPEAYRSFLSWFYAASRTDTALATKVSRADYFATNYLTDSTVTGADSLSRFRALMAYNVFELSDSAGTLSVNLIRPGEYDMRVNRIGVTPQLRPSRIPSTRRDAAGNSSPMKLLYVNGIATTEGEAQTSAALLQSFISLSAVSGLKVVKFWNPDTQGELERAKVENRCADAALRYIYSVGNPLISLNTYYRCKGLTRSTLIDENDFLQAVRQQLEIRLEMGGEVDAGRLAAVMKYYRQAGSNLILVTHSQGNQMAKQALDTLQAWEPTNPSGRCVEELSLAAPLSRGDFTTLAAADKDGFTMTGDVLLTLPTVMNDFGRMVSPFDAAMQADLNKPNYTTVQRILRPFYWALKMHGVNDNYFKHVPAQMTIIEMAQSLAARCPTQ